MLSGHVLDLLALLADHVSSILELSIDNLLVLDVDKRAKVDGECGDQGEAPEWNKLDQEVGAESRNESLGTVSVKPLRVEC